MPWNGSGVFNRVYNWTADANANIDILPDRMDTDTNDIATGLEHCLTVNGETLPVANINFNNYKITNAAQGTATQDYVTVGQVNSGGGGVSAGGFVPIAGGTVVGALTVNGAIYAAGAIRHPSIGATGNHNFAVGWDGSLAHIWVDGTDTGQQATVAWVQGQNYATQSFVTGQGYATQSWVQGQGYITNAALSGYATQSWVNSQGYATQGFVTGQGYATQSWVGGNFLGLGGGTISGGLQVNNGITVYNGMNYASGAPIVGNNTAYQGRDTGGNPVVLIYMGGDNTIHVGASGRNISIDASGSAFTATTGNLVVGGIVYIGNTSTAWRQDGDGAVRTDQAVRTGTVVPYQDNNSYSGLNGAAWAACYAYAYPGASDERLKTDLEEVPLCLDLVRQIRPYCYRFRAPEPAAGELIGVSEAAAEIHKDRIHWGFSAQRVKAAMDAAGYQFGGHYEGDDEQRSQALDSGEMLAVLWAAVRELAAAMAAARPIGG